MMFGWGSRSNSPVKRQHEEARDQKILAGQNALRAAAADTSVVAHEVTKILKEKLSDSNRKFDVATGILNDALIICDPEGLVLFANKTAETIFGGKITEVNFKEMLCPLLRHLDLWDLLTKSSHLHGLCDFIKCRDLDLKTEKLVWSDGSYSIFIVVRDPFHETIHSTHDDGCRYTDAN